MEFSLFDEDIFQGKEQRAATDDERLAPATLRKVEQSVEHSFSARITEPNWFMTSHSHSDTHCSENTTGINDLDMLRHRAALCYLDGAYTESLSAYELMLTRFDSVRERLHKLEVLEAICRCHIQLRNGLSALRFGLRFWALGSNADHEIQACYVLADVTSCRDAVWNDCPVNGSAQWHLLLLQLCTLILLRLTSYIEKNDMLWTRLGDCLMELSKVPYKPPKQDDLEEGDKQADNHASIERRLLMQLMCNQELCTDECNFKAKLTQMGLAIDNCFQDCPTALRSQNNLGSMARGCWVRATAILDAALKGCTGWPKDKNRKRHAKLQDKLIDAPMKSLDEARKSMCGDVMRSDTQEEEKVGKDGSSVSSQSTNADAAALTVHWSWTESADAVLAKWFSWAQKKLVNVDELGNRG